VEIVAGVRILFTEEMVAPFLWKLSNGLAAAAAPVVLNIFSLVLLW